MDSSTMISPWQVLLVALEGKRVVEWQFLEWSSQLDKVAAVSVGRVAVNVG